MGDRVYPYPLLAMEIPGALGRWVDSQNTWFFPMPGYMKAFIPWGRK